MKTIRDSFSLGQLIINQWKELTGKHGLPWNDSFIEWELPSLVDADFTVVVALRFAGRLGKKPYQLALELSGNLSPEFSFEITVTKEGYLNCHVKNQFYQSFLKMVNNDGQLISNQQKNLPSVNIEFVSANPTGHLHLGHLRNAVIGDTLAMVYEFVGYPVVREYYINDRGNQVEELINSVLFYYQQLRGCNSDFSEESLLYKGTAVKNAAKWLLENSASSDYDESGKNIQIKEKIIDFFVNKIKADLLLCGVEFDSWFSEKKMFSDYKKLNLLIATFKENNLAYYKDNALFLHTTLNGDQKDRVLIKHNGEFTYFLSDILYHLDKMERAELLINIWGSDHHGYVERLRCALRMLGYSDHQKLTIILIQMVTLLENSENKKFSKRAGTAIEIEETLSIIGKDQLRFCFLEKEAGHSISINLSLLREQEDKSRLYYLQYAHARCHQLILKVKNFNLYDNDPFMKNSFLLVTKKERNILKRLICFEKVIYSVITERKPFLIIQYLQSLAKEFQAYYHSYRIVDDSNHELTKQRIFLVSATKGILKKGLLLCGVDAPDLMKNMED